MVWSHPTPLCCQRLPNSVREIFDDNVESYDLSFYVRNASITDPGLFLRGIQVSTFCAYPNLEADLAGQSPRNATQEGHWALNDRLGIDFEEHIVVEKRLTHWAGPMTSM